MGVSIRLRQFREVAEAERVRSEILETEQRKERAAADCLDMGEVYVELITQTLTEFTDEEITDEVRILYAELVERNRLKLAQVVTELPGALSRPECVQTARSSRFWRTRSVLSICTEAKGPEAWNQVSIGKMGEPPQLQPYNPVV